MKLRMVLNPEKMPKKFLENFKAVKIHPIFKDLQSPLPFEGCSLCDIIRGLFIEMSTKTELTSKNHFRKCLS